MRQVAPRTAAAAMRGLAGLFNRVLAGLLIALVGGYKRFISPLLPPACRFTPTCSQYFIQAVQKYGPWKGAWKGVLRICRCHPFHPGGHDPP